MTVNGRVVREAVEPRLVLSDFLRHRLGLTGTHVGCEHGVCGACTVLLDGVAVRGCCLLAVQVDGCEVETVEALAADGALTALQEAFRRHHALQCGFCTPGILMAATDLLARGRRRRGRRSSTCSSGHLCRCTGYEPIVDAIEACATSTRARTRVNLARSLLAACERHPELEAFPGLTYGELLPRVRRLAGGLGGRAGRAASPSSSTTGSRPRSSTGRRSGAAPSFVPLSWRLSEDELDYCLEDCGARVVLRDGDPLPDGDEHPGALDRDERESLAAALHVGDDRPAEGRAALHTRQTGPAAGRRRSSTATASATGRSA